MMALNNEGAFFIDSLQGPDTSSNDLNVGLSGLSLSSSIPQGTIKHELASLSPATGALNLNGSFQGFLQQAPTTPIAHQQSQPQLVRHQSLDINDPKTSAPNNFGSYPANFSPSASMGNQGMLSPNVPLGDFLNAPTLNRSPVNQGGLSPLDTFNAGMNHLPPRGQFESATISPTKPVGNEIGRERSYSTPESSYNQFSRMGMPSPASASTNQMSSLYEDKPLLSPGGTDWRNSRPPRHGFIGINKDSNPSPLMPRPGMIRHTVSDGSFHSQQQQQQQQQQQFLGSSSPSFEASLQKVQLNSMGADGDSLTSPIQQMHRDSYQMQQGVSPQGFMNNTQAQGFAINAPPGLTQNNFVQHEQFLMQQGPPPNFSRHNSTGSAHFLVNERGEIVGHANGMIHSIPQSGPTMTPPTRQRAMSHADISGSPSFVQLTGQGNFTQLPPFPPFNDGVDQIGNVATGQMRKGSIGDGRMQQSTEPVLAPAFIQVQVSDESVSSGKSQPQVERELSPIIRTVEEEKEQEHIRVEAPLNGKQQSYASKLMTAPRPSPIVEKVSAPPVTAGANISKSGQKMIYTVKFKRSQRAFKLGERVTREVKIGCYVKVEADRGEDLGIVIGIVPVEKYLAPNRSKSGSDDEELPISTQITNIGDMRRIMRPATIDEINLLEVKKEEEDELLKICTNKARQRGLPMTLVDAEYQFDRNKLTFFFEAEGRIDFRELVRDLFSIYKTRIWMQQVNKDECEGKAQ